MENDSFGNSHLPSQALVVLSEAASGLHEALRSQRPFPTRLPDAKDLHNISLVGSYGTHLLHSFHPTLLQTLNHHSMLTANSNSAAAASAYFANTERGGGGLGDKPAVSLSNFQLPSAFSPPKYIGISLDQSIFNVNDSYRTDSTSPACTSHESLEGSNDFDTNGDKGDSPHSNNSEARDLRHVHNKPLVASTTATVSTLASSSSCLTSGGIVTIASQHQQQQQQQQQQHQQAAHQQHQHAHQQQQQAAHQQELNHPSHFNLHSHLQHAHTHAHLQATHPHIIAAASTAALEQYQQHQQQHQQRSHYSHSHHNHPNANVLVATIGNLGLAAVAAASGCHDMRGVVTSTGNGSVNTGAGGNGSGNGGIGVSGGDCGLSSNIGSKITAGGLSCATTRGHVSSEFCPVCDIKVTSGEWNSHFATELERLFKLSSGLENTAALRNTQIFGTSPCVVQESVMRTRHNRWESFQRIRSNRQNRLRLKVRKRKYTDDLYCMESLFCNSCPICKRKYALETNKQRPEDDMKIQEEIETVDVESCNDDLVPDSGSELLQHAKRLIGNSNMYNTNSGSNLSIKSFSSSASASGNCENDIMTATSSSSSNGSGNGSGSNSSGTGANTVSGSGAANNSTMWGESHCNIQDMNNVKNANELSSTTHSFYNADSCGEERFGSGVSGNSAENNNSNDEMDSSCNNNNNNNNESDEDVIVDDDDTFKMSSLIASRKRKFVDNVVSSRTSDSHSPLNERPRSETQVTSTAESNLDLYQNCSKKSSNQGNKNKFTVLNEFRIEQQHEQQQHQQQIKHEQQQSNKMQRDQQQTEPDNGICGKQIPVSPKA